MVSIVIVNYNTFAVTCHCIDSVLKYTQATPYEIIVVDNASPNDNPDDFIKKYPSVVLVKSTENGGFAKGNNLGIAASKGDIILLLNSDTLLTEDSISITAKYVQAHPETGAVSARLVYEDGKYQSNARAFRSIRNELLDLCRPLLYILPYRTRAKMMLNQYFRGDFNTGCDWVSGAYMMFNRQVLDKLPGKKLDERFFMYGEDHLWGYQIAAAGYRNFFLADTTVIHIANASTEPAKQLKLLKTIVSRELEIMKYRKGGSLYYYLFAMLFYTKEQIRYYIKSVVFKLFKHRIR